MKTVKLIDHGGQLSTMFIMVTVLSDATQSGGANYAEVARRCHVIRQLQKITGSESEVMLEDADFDTVKSLVMTYKWSGVDTRLEDLIRNILESPTKE